MIKIAYSDYRGLKGYVEELDWVWRQYLAEAPNDWYQFKYHTTIRHFLENDGMDRLFSEVHLTLFKRRVKLSKEDYYEIKELAAISEELQDILLHPPYGSMQVPSKAPKKWRQNMACDESLGE